MKEAARKSHEQAGGVSFTLERKRVKNVNLRVREDGSVHVSAPSREPLARIQAFVEAKRPWIEQRQELVKKRRHLAPEYWEDGETLRVWGERRELAIKPVASARQERVACADGLVIVSIGVRWQEEPRSPEAIEHREKFVRNWQADEVRRIAEPLLERYARQLHVQPSKLRTRTMSSRWGSCNVKTGAITLNTRLAEYEPCCLESVVVHELCHLVERRHNARFYAEMDQAFPSWREAHELLR